MKIFFRDTLTFNLDAGGGGGAPANGNGGAGSNPGGAPAAGGAPANLQQFVETQKTPASPAGTPQNPAPGNTDPAPGGTPKPADNSGSPQPYIPQDLPQQFRGANDKETIDKLAKDIADRPKPPAAPKDYTLKLSDDFTKKFGDLKDDPVVPMWREIAHELGLSNAQFEGVVPKLFERMEKAGLIDRPTDFEAETQKLAPGIVDRSQRISKASERINALAGLVKGLETRGEITKQEALILSGMYANADTIAAFEKIAKLIPKEHGIQGGGVGSGLGAHTWEDADRAMADPRYSTSSPKYDPAFRAAEDDKMKKLSPRGGYFLNGQRR